MREAIIQGEIVQGTIIWGTIVQGGNYAGGNCPAPYKIKANYKVEFKNNCF